MITNGKILNAEQVAETIGWPLELWPGNCYALALAFVQNDIIKGVARYGHYTGTVHRKSMFYDRWREFRFVPHGWVELLDGQVVDPTRYVLEGKEPYIYTGPAAGYDVGGSGFRDKMRAVTGPPPYDSTEQHHRVRHLPETVYRLLHLICADGRDGKLFTERQLHWIATANPTELGRFSRSIYTELQRLKQKALIPLDYWKKVMEGQP